MAKNGVSGVYTLLLFFITVTAVVAVNVLQLDFNSYSRAVFLNDILVVRNKYNCNKIGPARLAATSGCIQGDFVIKAFALRKNQQPSNLETKSSGEYF